MVSEIKQSFLILLGDYLKKKESKEWKQIKENIESLKKLADSHCVTGIIYNQIKNHSECINLTEWHSKYCQAISSSSQYTRLYQKIDRELTNYAIEHFQIKGLPIAQYYPIPQLRTMGDMDIMVHAEERPRVDAILKDMGFSCTNSGAQEWVYQKGNIHLEIHDKLLYYTNNDEDLVFADTVWNYVQNNELDISFHFVYLVLHLKKHFLWEGVGFRQFMDLCVVYRHIDKAWTDEKLKELGLYEFAYKCLALCERWFDIDLGLSTKIEIDDGFYENATNKIFDNGVFGFDDASNKTNRLVNEANKGRSPAFIFVRRTLCLLFPKYKQLIGSEEFSWLKGRMYLYPAAVVNRWVTRLKRIKKLPGHLDGFIISAAEIDNRNAQLENWGLGPG